MGAKLVFRVSLVIVSLILAVAFVFSVDIVRLHYGTSRLNVSYDRMTYHIQVSKALYARLPIYYKNSYPSEYGICIYGTRDGNDIKIYDGYEPRSFEKSEVSVGFICQGHYRGESFLGTVHSHPDSGWCVLSDQDKNSGEDLMGVQCSEDKILFYSSSDGYITGYYGQVGE